ncbi:IPP transferase-domain-containing protein [Astrocystis sublimbata]|nr:IPP transferase-domain-containing protein [Astrocystis sublimbata]
MASLIRPAPREPLVAVIGTTGTGKSDLAVDLALRFNGEIINADAMQMYRGLPVITNQLSPAEQRGVPHHLLAQIDALEPTWTNGLFVREARRLIEEIRGRGKLPIVVGGTLYYVHALLFGGNLINDNTCKEGADHGYTHFLSQEETRSQFPILEQDTPVILERLREVDPEMAARWHPDDRRKIKRSLEIYLTTRRKASEIYAEQQEAKEQKELDEDDARGPWETLVFWTYADVEPLRARLGKRVDRMVDNGLIDEVRLLHTRLRECEERGEVVDRTRGIWQSIGFKQMEAYLNGELELNQNRAETAETTETPKTLQKKKDEGLEEINIATRQYARYQLRWIRQRTLKNFKEHGAMDSLYLLDSTDAGKFEENVLSPAKDICAQYLSGEERLLPKGMSDTAREVFEAFENDNDGMKTTAEKFKVKNCELCDMSLPTEDAWQKHINGKKHKRSMKMKKRLALVPVEVETTSEKEALATRPAVDDSLS